MEIINWKELLYPYEQAVEELRAILCAEHCKPAERMNLIINRKEK